MSLHGKLVRKTINSLHNTSVVSELPGYQGRQHMRQSQSRYITAKFPQAITVIDQNFMGLEPPLLQQIYECSR